MIYEDALNIYTDGSSYPKKGRTGGVGIKFIWINPRGEEIEEDISPSGYQRATNNQMEIQACIIALREATKLDILSTVQRVVIFTDSQYVSDNYQRAMFEWPKNKWRGRLGRPILNAEQWKELTKVMRKTGKRVDFEKVKGHSKDQYNKAVDKLAKEGAKTPIEKPLTVVRVRRKITEQSVEIGSVEMQGQKVSIHVITSEYLRLPKTNKYKYEVVSKGSKYRGKVDIAFSQHSLKPGHFYLIQFNQDTNNPTIEKLIREMPKRNRKKSQ
jgi:ribonuclease HI